MAADFRLYDKAFGKALVTRNARVADLIRLSTARQQAADRHSVQVMRDQNLLLKGSQLTWVGPVSVVGNRATLQMCEKDDSAWFVYAASGKIAVPVHDRWNGYEVRALRQDGQWRFDRVTRSKTISCKGAK